VGLDFPAIPAPLDIAPTYPSRMSEKAAVSADASDLEKRSSYSNEKASKHSVDEVLPLEEAEVYDDVRAIDLDENGKERPISEYRFPPFLTNSENS